MHALPGSASSAVMHVARAGNRTRRASRFVTNAKLTIVIRPRCRRRLKVRRRNASLRQTSARSSRDRIVGDTGVYERIFDQAFTSRRSIAAWLLFPISGRARRVRPRFSPISRRVIGRYGSRPKPSPDDSGFALAQLAEALKDSLEVIGLDQEIAGGFRALVHKEVVELKVVFRRAFAVRRQVVDQERLGNHPELLRGDTKRFADLVVRGGSASRSASTSVARFPLGKGVTMYAGRRIGLPLFMTARAGSTA